MGVFFEKFVHQVRLVTSRQRKISPKSFGRNGNYDLLTGGKVVTLDDYRKLRESGQILSKPPRMLRPEALQETGLVGMIY